MRLIISPPSYMHLFSFQCLSTAAAAAAQGVEEMNLAVVDQAVSAETR